MLLPFLTCSISLSLREFQNAQTMVFAIEEINNRTDILPGVKLGYKIYDSCGSVEMAIRASLSLVNGNGGNATLMSCSKIETVQAIIGETSSTPTIAISATIGPLHIPVVNLLLNTIINVFAISVVCLKVTRFET